MTNLELLLAQKSVEIDQLIASGAPITADAKAQALELYKNQLLEAGVVKNEEAVVMGNTVNNMENVVNNTTGTEVERNSKIADLIAKFGPKKLAYTDEELTELYLPKLSEQEYRTALELANKIEKLKYKIYTQTENGIRVSDIELQNLNLMINMFRKITRTGYLNIISDKVSAAANKADVKSNEFVSDIEDSVTECIDNVTKLASSTVTFTGTLATGTVKAGASLLKGVMGAGFKLFK